MEKVVANEVIFNLICYYLFIYYTVYTHVKSFTIVKNRKCYRSMRSCNLEVTQVIEIGVFYIIRTVRGRPFL